MLELEEKRRKGKEKVEEERGEVVHEYFKYTIVVLLVTRDPKKIEKLYFFNFVYVFIYLVIYYLRVHG